MLRPNRSLACAIALGLAAGPAAAAEGVLEEVVVTAQKREQTLAEVPMSVAVVDQAALERSQVLSFEDYARGVAGVSFTQSGRYARGGAIPVIRGIAQINPTGPVSAFYLDETPLQPQEFERTGLPDPNMFDVARVEVLRGPQSDTYGSSALGGTIRVISNKPDPSRYSARASASASTVSGGSEGWQVNGMVNLPFSEGAAALRLVGTAAREGGYLDTIPAAALARLTSQGLSGLVDVPTRRDVNAVDSRTVRATLLWQPSERLTVTPSLFWQSSSDDRNRYVSRNLFQTTGGRYLDVDYGNSEFTENDFYVANVLVNYDLGFADLVSSTSRYVVDWNSNESHTGLIFALSGVVEPADLTDTGSESQWMQEFRLASRGDGPWQYLAGLFYREVTQELDQLLIAPSLVPRFGTPIAFAKNDENEQLEERAVFGQLSFRFAPGWEAAAGGRWFRYERNNVTPAPRGALGFARRDLRITEDGFIPSISLRYFPTEQVSVYGRAARGFRPGFSFATVLPAACNAELVALGIQPGLQAGQVASDSVDTYELGTKFQAFSGRVSGNVSVYRTKWQDIQVAVPLNCGFLIQRNAGEAEVQGAELELAAQAAERLSISASVGYTDSELKTAVRSIGGDIGEPLPAVSKWTVGVAAELDVPLGDDRGYVRLDWRYASDSHYSFNLTNALDYKPSTALLGARIGLQRGDWEYAIYGRNLTDQKRIGQCGRAGTRSVAPDSATCGLKPREIGISFDRRFE